MIRYVTPFLAQIQRNHTLIVKKLHYSVIKKNIKKQIGKEIMPERQDLHTHKNQPASQPNDKNNPVLSTRLTQKKASLRRKRGDPLPFAVDAVTKATKIRRHNDKITPYPKNTKISHRPPPPPPLPHFYFFFSVPTDQKSINRASTPLFYHIKTSKNYLPEPSEQAKASKQAVTNHIIQSVPINQSSTSLGRSKN